MGSHVVDKSELCRTVAHKLDKTIVDVDSVLDCVMETIVGMVSGGNTVRLKGFGKFENRFRPSRSVVSPQTGESYQTAAKRVPFFTPGTPFKASVIRAIGKRK